MADTEFKGKLVEASPSVRPDIITDPEENKRRAATWKGVRKHRKLSWVELTDYAEKRCDFTPEYDVDDGVTYSDNFYCEDCEENFEGVERHFYNSMDYTTPEVYTTEIPQKRSAFNDTFEPSEEYNCILDGIKYGKGLNNHWRIKFLNKRMLEEYGEKCKHDGVVKGGKVSKRPPEITLEELFSRAQKTGNLARKARFKLKKISEGNDENAAIAKLMIGLL